MATQRNALSYSALPTNKITASNGIEYAYREIGTSSVPLVLLQHFRGNLDNWDPALIDDLGALRRVITFNNTGVGSTSGSTPRTIYEMAGDTIAFAEALGLAQVDLLGFSIGSFIAQEIALARPAFVRKMILASSAPKGAPGMHGWAAWVIEAVGSQERTPPDKYISVFFAKSKTSSDAGAAALQRMFTREEHDTPTSWQTRTAQYDAVCEWGIPNYSLLQRLEAIEMPVFVANGDSDPMILPKYSYLLHGLLPDSRMKIYPDSAHGFLFQHHTEFAADVHSFLDEHPIP
jgi:pimeloyl-ACP methyl ester carboxylesterase